MSGAPLVSLRGATVRFGDVTALRDATLDVHRGDVIALVGSNGSGKTTLLRALHGLVRVRGERAAAAGIVQAMVFQRPFMLRLSVRNNLRVAFWLARLPRAESDRLVRESLQRVGLAGLEERPARALSGGQQQRLALARAWALRPALLYLDEPTASLDPAAKNEVEALLAGFVREGATVVMSTHNLGQAKRLATRVVYLEGGVVHDDRPTAEFFGGGASAPAQAFLRG